MYSNERFYYFKDLRGKNLVDSIVDRESEEQC